MFERFTNGAREVVVAAQDEARQLGHDYIGTEHLLIGVLARPESRGRLLLAERGLTADQARADVKVLIGPGAIDPEALATIGIDLEEVRRRVEEAFGPGALEPTSRRCGRVPFTPRSKQALENALRAATKLKANAIETDHVLIGVLAVDDGVAVKILARAGLSAAAVRDEVESLLGPAQG
jgi:ATP-dependent Clp protease ATP-binding subunit ClpA